MEQELLEISRQLRELSARLDALIAASRPEQLPELEPEPLEVEEEVEEPVAAAVAAVSPVKLTVNDRYRFLRELFGGDAEAMDCALAEIGDLTSAAEVEAYVADVLGFEPERHVAAEFLATMTERFRSRPTLLA